MGMRWLHDLPQVLAGLPDVGWYPGWETRSRSSGGYDNVMGVVVHHTASNTTTERDIRYMWMNAAERPIGAIYLSRTGAIVVGAAGATNCQGAGGPRSTSKGIIPINRGNQNAIAVEAGNSGVGEPWPQVQQDRYIELVRRLIQGYGLQVGDVFAHREWTMRKIDPAGPSRFGSVNRSGSWDMNLFRTELVEVTPPPDPTTPPPVITPPPGVTPPPTVKWYDTLMQGLPVLKQGANGPPVKRMQHLLAASGHMDPANTSNYDGAFGSGTASALKRFQTDAGIPVDAVCGPITWGALMHTADGIPTLKKGALGGDVERMQHLLAAAGFMNEANTGNYDGQWGDGTETAKTKFDNAKGLTPSPPTDCGPKSWTKLLQG